MKFKKGTFINIPNKQVIKGQKASTQSVYLWICEHADDEGLCFPSYATLGREAGVSRRQAMREVGVLQKLGILVRTNRTDDTKNLTNIYQIMIVEIEGGGDTQSPGVVTVVHQGGDTQSHRTESNELTPIELPPAEPAALAAEVHQVFEIFYRSVNPNINYANRTNRAAAEFLIKKHGLDKTLGAARYACSVQNEQFAPTITTPYQLKEKMAALAKYKLGQSQNKGIKIAQ